MTSNERRKQKRYEKRVRKRQKKREQAIGTCDDIEGVMHPDRLFDAFHECQKNVNWKASVQSCHYDLLFRITDIENKRRDHKSLRHGFVCFSLVERGKLRYISSVHINERIVQRSLCDNALAPVCFHSILYNNGASVKGAGIRRAEEQMKNTLLSYYRTYGTNEGYIIFFDVKGYFDNIRHDVIERILADHIKDPKIRELFNEFTEAFDEIHDEEHQGKGVGLGSQVSQISGVMALNEKDHYICEMLSDYVFDYARYMDDSKAITRTKEDALYVIDRVEEKYQELGLELNRKKTVILPLNRPFVWLKKKYMLKDSGRVRVALTGSTIKRERKSLRKYLRWLEEGKANEVEVKDWYVAWRKGNQFYDSNRMLEKMDVYYESLFGGRPAMKLTAKDKKRRRKRDKMQLKSEMLKRKYPKSVIILQSGMFYNARGESAIILSELTGYRLRRYPAGEFRCSYPQESMERVVKILSRAEVNYAIYGGEFLIDRKEYPNNHYDLLAPAEAGNGQAASAKPLVPTMGMKMAVETDPLIEFIDNLINKKDPFYGVKTDTLNLTDEDVQKNLVQIKRRLLQPPAITETRKDVWDWDALKI